MIPGSGRSTGEGIEQELHGLEEASICDSEVVWDGDDEHYKTKERYETVCPYLLARSLVQQKDGAKKARESRESSGTKEAKRRGVHRLCSQDEVWESQQGARTNPSGELRAGSGSAKATPAEPRGAHGVCRYPETMLRRKHNEDLDFKLVEDDGETMLCLNPAGPLPPQLLHLPGRWRGLLKTTRVLQAACETAS